jgi:hypothetical protein
LNEFNTQIEVQAEPNITMKPFESKLAEATAPPNQQILGVITTVVNAKGKPSLPHISERDWPRQSQHFTTNFPAPNPFPLLSTHRRK